MSLLGSHSAACLSLSADHGVVSGTDRMQGFSSCRGVQGVSCGSWFFEAEILVCSQEEKTHVRLGWSTALAELMAPVGFDAFGFGIRDVDGSAVHAARRVRYGSAFEAGDVIGCGIELPERNRENTQRLENREILVGSRIEFFVNGKSQGIAFAPIFQDTYFPTVSIYGKAAVRVNDGPDFKFPPKDNCVLKHWKPICQFEDED